MEGERKPFDKELFEENDPKAREVVKAHFATRGVVLTDNPDRYGVDLIGNEGAIALEVERRPVWEGEEFPFSEVNVPQRKAKFFRAGAAYVIVSKDFTRIGVVRNSVLLGYLGDDKLRENPNRYVHAGELFYKIPKGEFYWSKIS